MPSPIAAAVAVSSRVTRSPRTRLQNRGVLALGLLVAAGCLSDPLGPAGRLVISVLDIPSDTVLTGAPGRPLAPIRLRAVDGAGRAVVGAEVHWSVAVDGSSVAAEAQWTDGSGTVAAIWSLGVRASEPQRLVAEVRTRLHRTSLTLEAQAIPSEATVLEFAHDTLVLRLGTSTSFDLVATDPFGNPFVPQAVELSSLDQEIAAVDPNGSLVGYRRGVARVVAAAGPASDTGIVRVVQVVESLTVGVDTVAFHSLAQTESLVVELWDDQGRQVLDSQPVARILDTWVATTVPGSALAVRSLANGLTTLQLEVGTARRDVPLLVSQVPERIEISGTEGIVGAPLDSVMPLACAALDRNGFALPGTPLVDPSPSGRWTGQTCDGLRLAKSGFDTLRVRYGPLSVSRPVVLAVRPTLGPVELLAVDSLPANVIPWAPSARRNGQGQLELYFAGYSTLPDSTGHYPADLYRLISPDGQQFAFDGIVLTHDADYCDLNGSGIENIDIVPRADGPGWRMFYSGGSFDCYGWQVFSAVSSDERTWTKEPGVRIQNGGSLPPDPPNGGRWPAGEGMVTDQLPDGTWRMIVSTYEPITPPEDKFQITEWRSPDQLNWSYLRSLVTTRQLPPEGQRSAYSPTIREVVPGLWRMVFTADDRHQPGGRSRLWSAISTDQVQWQIEGEILGEPGLEYLYSVIVDDRLFTLRSPQGVFDPRLVSLTVQMP